MNLSFKSSTAVAAAMLLTLPAAVHAADWYTRYQHTDNGLVAGFDFNANDPAGIRDEISRKTAVGSNLTSVEGWKPVASYKLEGKKLSFDDTADAAKRKDFTVVFYGKVSGTGYAVLKKGSFGLVFDNGKASMYFRSGKRDMGIAAGGGDGAYHTWVMTAAGKTIKTYCDGKLIQSRTAPAPVSSGAEPLLIGNSGGWKKTEVSGNMGLLRIYSKALSGNEIAALSAELAKGNVPLPDASLALQLPMGARNVFVGDDISYEKKELAWYFDGKSSGIKLPDYPQLRNNVTALTVGAWIKPELTMPRNISQQGYIVSANSGAHCGWSIGTYYNNGINVNLVTDKGRFSASAAQVLKKGVWQHVAFTWDGKVIQLFVNGQPVGKSVLASGTLKALKSRGYIGKAADRDGIYFKGAIDELKIFNAALSIDSDPDTGKAVTLPAKNVDDTALSKPLPRLHGTENHQPVPGTLLCDFEDLSNWKVTGYKNIAEGKLCRSQDDRLWGDYNAKLTMQAGTHFDPARKMVSIAPVQPLQINDDFDYISLYLSAQNWTKPTGCKLRVTLLDADNKELNVEMQSAEIPFIFWSGWSFMVKKVPFKVKTPAKLTKLTFYNFGGQKPEVYYIDNLSVHKLPPQLPGGIEVPSWKEVGAPTVATGAMPTMTTAEKPVKFSSKNGVYTFTSEQGKDKLVYTYKPISGTLSDITLSFNGGKAFQPMKNGGFSFVAPDGKLLEANASGLQSKLLSAKVSGNKVKTQWAWSYKGKTLGTTGIELSAQRKTLSVRLTGGNGKVHEVRTGMAAGLSGKVTLTNLPYWVIRSRGVNDPAILYNNKMLLSAIVDIYASNASALIGGSGKRGNDWQINGGAAYQVKSDNSRNEIDEVFHLTASSIFSEVVPHIANPRNPTMDITRNGIWVTRMWYDVMPYPNYFKEAYKMWELYHRYGMRNLMIRDHQTLGRQYSPKRRGGYDGMVDTILPDLGGDEAAAEYFRKSTDNLGYRMGLYSNFTLLPSVGSAETSLDKMTLNSDQDTRYGSGGSKMCKYAYIIDIQKRVNAELKRKFKLKCTYPDQYTCRAPWAFTDSDVRVPEAGKFSPALRVLAKSLIIERQDFEVPLSEGIMQWPLAGFCDSYAQNGSPDDPLFPEFQLRKIQPLSNDCGQHLRLTFTNNMKLVDRYLALSLGNGTIGHIFGPVGGKPPKVLKKEVLKSYYIFKQTQKHYAGVPVRSIEYHYNGKLMDAAAIIAAGKVGYNQLKIVYSNGTEVYVNANEKDNYTINANGKALTLPPNGYYVSKAGAVETASVLNNGKRIDYSIGDEYIYVNGNGIVTDFGAVKCANSYALLFENNAVEIIPVPFVKAETITVDLSKLPVKAVKKLIRLDQDKKVLGEEKIASGKLSIKVDKKTFSYILK